MNKRIFGSIAAIITVLGLIGGGTFAFWSDDVSLVDNKAGAETLTLSVQEGGSAAVPQTNLSLAPGTERFLDYTVVSRSGDNTLADLFLTIENLDGHENGCDGSEIDTPDADCNDTATAGEFITEATYFVRSSDPVPAANACPSYENRAAGLPNTNSGVFKLVNAEDIQIRLTDVGDPVGPGEKVCVNVQIALPFQSSTNASQGDWAEFDMTYDLIQVPGTP